jgi:predicted oxidoreductase (fatty acid repression mutant protein)
LIYENRSVHAQLRDAWSITDEQASAFVQQSLGMVQLSLWLSLTEDGLVTSLQHWDWLLEDRIADFAGIATDRYKLSAVLPIGYPDEPPRAVERTARHRVVSRERVEIDVTGD